MRCWQFAVVGLACLAPAGCRTDPNIAILERELRLQEDEIYRLRRCIRQHERMLESAPESAVSRDVDRSGATAPPDAPTPEAPEVELPGTETAPEEALRHLEGSTRLELRPPAALGPENARGRYAARRRTATPVRSARSSRYPPPLALDGREGRSSIPLPQTDSSATSTPADGPQVAELVLDPQSSGGYDSNASPGDEGIEVVAELRDSQGRPITALGAMDIALLDPALEDQGDAARVARWALTADQVAANLRKAGSGGGIELRLPWTADPPAHNRLQLFVRYVTVDGRTLQTDIPIRVALPGDRTAEWIATEPAQRATESQWRKDPMPAPATPRVRLPTATARRTTERTPPRPAKPAIQRPVWSPNRR